VTPPPDDEFTGTEIAVIAMAGRFPGAETLEQFWANIRDGVESVHRFTDDELLAAGEDPDLLAHPAYVRASPQLDGIELFDAFFFGMSPRDASVMDPQHRLFLEVAWEALERAGYSGTSAPMATGVYAAAGMNHYMLHHVVPNRDVMRTVGEWLARHTGNDMNFLATRAAYQMNLKGPAMNVQTACSSSLSAIHLACQSLINRETDLALAGASTLSLPQDRGYVVTPGEILSADGHCRPFDAGSTGTLFGSGVGCVVLKRVTDAIADGDTVLAVIRSTAINNDGSSKVGYLAPSVDGQARVVAEAIGVAGVPAESIGLIEAHGTGTAVGDPIEVEALTRAYAPLTSRRGIIALGSVKANIGHLGEAAGMAGVIKTILALQHGQLPPCVNFVSPNPQIDFGSSPFYVNTQLRPWPRTDVPRRAGVTALGAGGTNAHLILEEAPATAPSAVPARAAQLFTVSARTRTALERACAQLAQFLDANPTVSLADAAWTLQQGRVAFPYRWSVTGTTAAGVAAALREPHRGAMQPVGTDEARLIFMFPGGGAQYAAMGRELYETEPAYRTAFDACLAEMPVAVAGTLRRLVFATGHALAEATLELETPRLALPALFATEYATARLLADWGVEPAGMIGHSVGEYVAACLSGVFTRRDALMLVMERARLFETLPAGGMVSVPLAESDLLPLLGPDVSIAAVNGPALCVASGPVAALDALQAHLATRDIESSRLHIAVAAHSQMLDPILADFARVCAQVRFSAPTVPFISNLTGAWITSEEAMDPQYWVRHLRQTVRFGDGLHTVLAGGRIVLLEVGPGRSLASLARMQSPVPVAVTTLRHPREQATDVEFLLTALGRVWQRGAVVVLGAHHGGTRRRRIPLPTYPFERERFWLDAGGPAAAPDDPTGDASRHTDVREWFSTPAWRRTGMAGGDEDAHPGIWLVFADRDGMANGIAARRPAGQTILVVRGERFARLAPHQYALRPDAGADFVALFESLVVEGRWPVQVVHLWGLDARPRQFLDRLRRPSLARQLDAAVGELYVSLLCIVQATAEQELPLVLTTVARGLFACTEDDAAPDPMKALLLGPTQVAPREVPELQSRSIDVGTPDAPIAIQVARLLRELQRPVDEPAIALRATARWVRVLAPVPLAPVSRTDLGVREHATVLISGGLGGIGLSVAVQLARQVKARLILLGRTAMPERSEWTVLARGDASDLRTWQAARLLEIEAAGGEVLVLTADVTDLEQMTRAVTLARARFGPIHGVIHGAGIIDDGLIALKSPSAPTPVITVKARGALILEAVMHQDALDFFIVFSSVSAVLGLEGQVDYTAANAFLDAFVERMRRTSSVRALSIGWNMWRDVGMTAALADGSAQPVAPLTGRPGPHPDLERVVDDANGALIFSTRFDSARHWQLREHVVRGGEALLPGTGYLELARAALDPHTRTTPLEMRDVMFLAPFMVGRAAPRVLRLRLAPQGLAGTLRDFTFTPDGETEPNVVGQIGEMRTHPEAVEPLAVLRARLGDGTSVGGFPEQRFMAFGPRWGNVQRVAVGEAEALLHLRLPDAYHADLLTYRLHPALLDMATGGAQLLIPAFDPATDVYVPIRYDVLRQFAGLTPEVFSHVRYDASRGSDAMAYFDADLYAADGNLLVQIRGFTMKKLEAAAFLCSPDPAASAVSASRATLRALLGTAIGPADGVDAFDRILGSGLEGHVLASSVDLPRWSASLERRQAAAVRTAIGTGAAASGFGRPDLGTTFVEPRTDLERELCELWTQLLGVNTIGVHDDFFELGGQSLVAVRLFGRIRKRYRVDLPISTLFEAPTVAQCAAIITAEAEPTSIGRADVRAQGAAPMAGDAAPAASERAERVSSIATRWRSLVVMQPKGTQPPFVCVAGMGGTLNNLRRLALLLGDARPCYGLQPPGADNPEQLLDSVEALAAHYITEVRREQPAGPYYLGGYSGGGVAAFEMARQLLRQGERVAFLGLIDSFSPQLPKRTWRERALLHARRAAADGPAYLTRMLRHRLVNERETLRLRMGRQLGRVMPEQYRYEAIMDAWRVAEGRYLPTPEPLRGTLFRAREETAISLWTGVKVDEAHGWGRYLLQGVDIHVCAGNHTTMCEEPNVRVLASRIQASIDAAAAAVASHVDWAPVSSD